MTSANTEFNRLDRGYPRDLVLIPGWAMDVRIFEPMDLPFNYILPGPIDPETFAADLHRRLDENNCPKVSLLGWSMGGFLAADFAARFPSQVSEVFLVGVRDRFDAESLRDIKTILEKDRRAYLYGFYTQCFRHCSNDQIVRFKRSLLKPYLESMILEDLLHGLDYLVDAEMDTQSLSAISTVQFFHGELDEISPVSQARNLASSIPHASFRNFPNLGHIVFYDSAFCEGFDE